MTQEIATLSLPFRGWWFAKYGPGGLRAGFKVAPLCTMRDGCVASAILTPAETVGDFAPWVRREELQRQGRVLDHARRAGRTSTRRPR
jgi:hypothetical protein